MRIKIQPYQRICRFAVFCAFLCAGPLGFAQSNNQGVGQPTIVLKPAKKKTSNNKSVAQQQIQTQKQKTSKKAQTAAAPASSNKKSSRSSNKTASLPKKTVTPTPAPQPVMTKPVVLAPVAAAAPATPAVPQSRLDRMHKATMRLLYYDYSQRGAGGPTLLGEQSAIAIGNHQLLTTAHAIAGTALTDTHKLFLQTGAPQATEVRILDFDLVNDLALLYSPAELGSFLTTADLGPGGENEAKNQPWILLNYSSDFGKSSSGTPRIAVPDEMGTIYPLEISGAPELKKEGSLLIARDQSVAGMYLGQQTIASNLAIVEAYLPKEAMLTWFAKSSAPLLSQPNFRTTQNAFTAQILLLQTRLTQGLLAAGPVEEPDLGDWHVPAAFKGLTCKTDPAGNKKTCTTHWPYLSPNKSELFHASMIVQTLNSDPRILQEQTDKLDQLAQEKYPEYAKQCHQHRIQLGRGRDSQVQVCVKGMEYGKQSLVRGVVLDKSSPLYFQIEMSGFTAAQSYPLARSFLAGIDKVNHADR